LHHFDSSTFWGEKKKKKGSQDGVLEVLNYRCCVGGGEENKTKETKGGKGAILGGQKSLRAF